MGSLLGFQDETVAVVDDDEEKSTSSSSSYGYKLVPWLNWNEWECVRDSFFSESPENILSAINRISTWRSRGCLPVVIDVTASIIEVQQKDPLYRKDLPDNALHSEQMLAMLYCMAILRLVNCVVEKTRKKTQVSIAEAAGAIGIPRTLIDIRHGTHLTSRAYRTETGQIERLSSLFAWLVGQLKGLKPLRCKETAAERKASSIGMNLSNTILMEVLRKCLLVSSNGNKQLMDSALHLAQLMGDTSVMGKLKKLSSLVLSDPDVTQEKSSLPSLNNLLIQQDESIHQATKKLEFVKFCRTKSKAVKRTDGEVGSSGGWAVAKSWNPCPIGMLPRDLGSSGHLPVLDCADDGKKPVHSSEWKQSWELKQGSSGDIRFSYGVERTSSKREAGCDIYLLDKSSAKKMRETADSFESDCENVLLSGDDKGCLMINGVWKKIGEEELLTIMSDVRILV
uniref:Las1-like family protein n=1 Tax=Populus trichocarpa TaxID=3694 RepID=A0A2K2C4J8_POPTR